MTGGDFAAAQAVQHRLGQLQQPHQVGDGRAVDLQPPREILLRTAVLFQIPFKGQRLFDRIEVLAVQVFHDGQFGD